MPVFDTASKGVAVDICHSGHMVSKFGTKSGALSMTSHRRPRWTGRSQPGQHADHAGFTLLELMIAVAILAVLASIGMVSYRGYIDTTKIANAKKQILTISLAIDDFHEDKKVYPASLADLGLDTIKDPWGNPYHYLNIATAANLGLVRKDHNLVPLNTDYDLYSSGKDGQSSAPLTAKASLDDIVRANNGGFVGLASNY